MNKIKRFDEIVDGCDKALEKEEEMTQEMVNDFKQSKKNAMLERIYWTIRKRLDK